MCALSGSFKPAKAKELYNLNSYRGTISSSLSIFSQDAVLQNQTKFHGEIDSNEFDDMQQDGNWILTHSQAPTSAEEDIHTIHPAVYKEYMVWHNGIIKKDSMDAWNQRLGTNYKWDTALLAHIIYEEGYEVLSEVDGSFACVLYAQDQGLYVFRNIIAPLFIDIHMNLSSTKFGKASLIEPHVVHKLKLNKKELTTTSIRFTTFDNPYYFV